MSTTHRRRVRKPGAAPHRPRARGRPTILWLELLENRILLSAGDSIANAIGLVFSNTSASYQTAHVSEYLANSGAVELNRINLNGGDVVTASVNTSPYGGGLNSYLRIFQDLGGGRVRQIASNDNFQGQDAGLTFQAPATGTYYVGVSSFDNTAYDPQVAGSGSGSSHGLFDLNLSRTQTAAPPGLVAASIQVSQALAVWGDTVTVGYTIENRDAADAGPATVSLLASVDNRFDDGLPALQSTAVPALGGGDAYQGSFTVTLGAPGTPLSPFQGSQEIFLGLQIGSTGPASPEQGNDWAPVQMLQAETAAANSSINTLGTAQPVALNSRIGGITIPAGGEAFFQITLTQSGNLTAQVAAAGGAASLTLYDARGIPIVQSDGQSPAIRDPLITQALAAGTGGAGATYYLKLASPGASAGTYNLTTLFTPSTSVVQTVPAGAGVLALATGDFNGDGKLDLVIGDPINAGVTVFLGQGDGTFQKAGSYSDSFGPVALAVGDFNGDGKLDLAAATPANFGVAVLLGNGDGTFQPAQIAPVEGGTALAAGDFNGDGKLDLAVAYPTISTVTVLLGNGDGTFQAEALSVPGEPDAVVAGDFNGDGKLDLAVGGYSSNQVTVLLGQGDGTFQPGASYAVGTLPIALTADDFNGDGRLDLAAANHVSGDVSVLLGQGDGTFQPGGTYAVGSGPVALVAGDFNGDGLIDLATANEFSNDVTVLLGQGDGTFHAAYAAPAGSTPDALVAGDFNGDGHADLAAGSYTDQGATVLLGRGDGTFMHGASTNATGQAPDAMVEGDFNGDGRLDLAVADLYGGDVTVLLGQGDGTFQPAGTFAAGASLVALVAGDFNGDGRLDLAVADQGAIAGPHPGPAGVAVLLGHGDGTFLPAAFYDVDGRPAALAAGDFNEDGRLDLAVAIKSDTNFTPASRGLVLLGQGDGTFTEGSSFTTGSEADALVAEDFNGDGHLDLAVGDYGSQDVTVLVGDGHGDFSAGTSYAAGGSPGALVAGDFNGDGHPDLAFATVSYTGSTVAVLLNHGDGTFSAGQSYAPGTTVTSLAVGDFNGDGRLDLAVANNRYASDFSAANTVTVLLGNGDGTFTANGSFPAGSAPVALVTGDFNGDGRLDLAAADAGTGSVTALLGTGTGTFLTAVLAPSPVQSTPLVADLTGDGAPDALVLTQTGRILFRQGLANEPGAFAPPVVINPDPQLAARDLALVATAGSEPLVAALDAETFAEPGDPTAPPVARVTLYLPQPDGTFTTLTGFDLPAGFLPANIASADLTGDGLGDLVITAAASDQVFVSLQTAPGIFDTPTPYSVGVNPSAIELVDVNGDSRPDVVVADRFSGQVSVLLNQGDGAFGPEERFRAGTGLYGLAPVNGAPAVQSLEGTNGVVAGSFGSPDGTDLVVLNGGTDGFAVLPGDGLGGFLNPQAALSVSTAASPTAIVAGHFIAGDPGLDLAVLSKDSDSISIYRGDGQGGFTLVSTVDAGNEPTGVAVADVSRPGGGGPDGLPDLLVGNAFGDLLILPGNGDGTFSPYRRADQSVSLAVAAAPGTGQNTFLFSDQGNDQLAYAAAAPGAAQVVAPTVYQDRGAGIQAPGPEAVVTVLGTQYLVVANSGANEVLIYTLGPDGQPDPASRQTYFTGTDPVSLTVTTPANDLNGDNLPDLVVANEGSNDVSVFLGQLTGNTWTLAYRPRQSSGGLGPTSVAIADVPGANGTGPPGGSPDLLVSNGQSNQVSVLASRGNGFFINQAGAPPLLTGNDPGQVFVGNFDGTGGLDLVTVNAGSNDVTLIENFLTDPVTSTIASGGTLPVAAVAVDLRGNGTSDLLVANAGNGVVEMLQGSPGGFEVATTLGQTTLQHLSDLALVTAGNQLEVYGTEAARETAVLLETFGPPVTPPNFLPPGPGFPTGIELQAEAVAAVELASAAPSNLLVPAGETTPEGGATLPVLASALIATDLQANPPSELVAFLPLPASAAAPWPQDAAPAAGPRDPQRPGNAAGILLLNLTDPEDNNDDRNGPDDLEPSDEFEPALVQGANNKSRGLIDAVRTEAWAVATPPWDLFRQATGDDVRSTGGPPGQPVERAGRTAEGVAEQLQSFSGPGQQPRARPEEEDLVTEAWGPEDSLAAKRPAVLRQTDAAAAATGLWCTLPLMWFHVLDTLRRRRAHMKLFLRKVRN